MVTGKKELAEKRRKDPFNIKEGSRIGNPISIRPVSTDPDHSKYFCTCCGKGYKNPVGNFVSSFSPLYAANGGYVNICKACLDVYYRQLVDAFNGNEEQALDRICQILDWYYSPIASDMTLKRSTGSSTRAAVYPSAMNTKQVRAKGVVYLDTLKDKSITDGVILDASDVSKMLPKKPAQTDAANNKLESKTAAEEVSEDMIRFWGYGYKPTDYIFLQEQFEDWKARNECKTKAQEELFKMICVAQLNVQIAQRDGGKVSDAMDVFQRLLGSANLKPNQTNDNAFSDTQTFGTLIQKWEETKPIPEPDPEFKDPDGIKKYITTWFTGHLSKALGIKNDSAREYEEELKKYTVKKPSTHTEESDLSSILPDGDKGGGAGE